MATTVTMPKLGLTMTEGTVTEWKKNEGEPVKKGEVIFVVATDKLNYEVEAEAEGILAKVLVSLEGFDASSGFFVGVIGVEFASIYASLGTSVTIVEMLPDLLPNTDREVVEVLKKTLQLKGVEIYTSSKVTRFRDEAGKVVSEVETDGGKVEVVSEKVLVSVGRKPVTTNLGLENTGVKLNRGRISVDRYMKTTGKNIYAIGDCCSPIMLAHVASREGEVAAENIMGHSQRMDYKTTPDCVYTTPEIAWVGMTEEQAAEKGYKVKTGKFPLMANGKCLIMNDTAGFIKFVVDAKHDEILGVHIVGPRATDLIVEGALALRLEATIDEIVTTIHAHPTVGEALGEAALDVNGAAIHMPPKQ